MKIVIITSYAYPYVGNGIGNVATKQAEELAKKDNNVTLFSSKVPYTESFFTKNNVFHIKTPAITWLEKVKLHMPFFLPNKKILNSIKESDIIHLHDILYPCSLIGLILAKYYRKPIVLTQHIGFIEYDSKIVRLIEKVMYHTLGKFILKRVNKIFVLNNKVKEYMLKLGAKENKIDYLENGVDSNLFKPTTKENKLKLRKKYNLPQNKKIVLFVGRFVEKKGFDKLFEARSNDYHILMVGDGEIPEHMKEISNVSFMKALPQEKLKEIYQLADVFCLPSKGEGFPLAIQEAMASGLPVITSDVPEYKNYLKKEGVELITPKPNNINKSIVNILKDKKRYNFMKEYSLKTAKVNFSWERNINKLIKEYKSLK